MATVTKKVMAAIETDARKNERLYKNSLMRLVAKIKKIVMEESDPADIVAVLRTLSTSKEFLLFRKEMILCLLITAPE